MTFAAENGKTYTINNFGLDIETYYAKDAKDFFASDSTASDKIPKLANDNTEVGWLYRRNGVKVGYAVDGFNFDGLSKLVLKMVRYEMRTSMCQLRWILKMEKKLLISFCQKVANRLKLNLN